MDSIPARQEDLSEASQEKPRATSFSLQPELSFGVVELEDAEGFRVCSASKACRGWLVMSLQSWCSQLRSCVFQAIS